MMEIQEFKDKYPVQRETFILSTWDTIEKVIKAIPSESIEKKILFKGWRISTIKAAIKDLKILGLISNGGNSIKLNNNGITLKQELNNYTRKKYALNAPLFSYVYSVFPQEPDEAELNRWLKQIFSVGYHMYIGLISKRLRETLYVKSEQLSLNQEARIINNEAETALNLWKHLIKLNQLTIEEAENLIIVKNNELIKKFIFDKYKESDELFKYLLKIELKK